jgi:hypothetical protein
MTKDTAIAVRESEFRLAIHQTHNCEAEVLVSIVHIKSPSGKDAPCERNVHVFEVSGHSKATRCYAWLEPLGKTAITIRAVLHSDKISSPEKAVQSAMRRARRSGAGFSIT